MFEWSLQKFTSETSECHILKQLQSANLTNCIFDSEQVDISIAQSKLDEIMHNVWHAELPSKPNPRIYSIFKN